MSERSAALADVFAAVKLATYDPKAVTFEITDTSSTGVPTLTDYEPLPGDVDLGHVYVAWAGEDADNFHITVGVIARSPDGSAQKAQELRLALIDGVDAALKAASLGPPDATGTFIPEWNAWGATWTVEYGRDIT